MARAKTYKPSAADREAIDIVTAGINECKRWHVPFQRKVEKRWGAYRGLSEEAQEVTWRSNVKQPLLINIVEGMLATMEDAEPTWDVFGRVYPGMEVEEALAQSDTATIAACLLRDQMRIDQFAQKQGPFMLQDLVASYTVGKVGWLRKQALHRYHEEEPEMVYDEAGGTLDIADVLNVYEEDILVRDDPTFEVRDVRDWMYPESATSIEAAPYVIDRTFVKYSTVAKMEALGIYENVEFLKDFERGNGKEDQTTRQGPDIVQGKEQSLRNVDRTRGLVEIVEWWSDEEVITVGNRSILLRRKPNPHWHGQKPFICVSAIPDAFSIPGISVIEGLAQMQEMIWTLQNTRLDATRMAANLIKVIRGDVENSDDFEWAPNADWFVRDVNDVKLLEVPMEVLRATLESEGLLKGDLNSVMGGLPSTGGQGTNPVLDQNTATGISIVTNIAQAILGRRKSMYSRGFEQLGGMFLSLDQQMLKRKRLVEIIGEGGARRYEEVGPMELKGFFDVKIKWQDDSMMRQEKRAESGQLLTQSHQFAGPAAQAGVNLNLKKFWQRHLEAFGIADTESYFMPSKPSQLMPAGPGAPGGGTPQGAESMLAELAGGTPPGGITNESLAAGPTSPSSPVTMSAAAPAQRAGAMVGAGRSV